MRNVKTEIRDPNAYYSAKDHYIKLNASKTRLKKWLALAEDHQEIYDWLDNSGQYGSSPTVLEDGTETVRLHPLSRYQGKWSSFDDLLDSLAQSLCGGVHRAEGDWWGQLSEKQTDIARKALARTKEWQDQREIKKAEYAEIAKRREYVGEIGDKKFEVQGRIAFVTSWDTQWGTTWLTTIRDDADNSIVYKGSKFLGRKSDHVEMIATIKDHKEYKGEKQTIVARPRQVILTPTEEK